MRAFPNERVAIVLGDDNNFKITTTIDVITAEATLQSGRVETHTGGKAMNALRNVVVVGGGEGVGNCICERLTEQGVNVTSLSRRSGFDVRDTKLIIEEVERIDKIKPIDGLVITAGVLFNGDFENMPLSKIDEIILVNLTSIFKIIHGISGILKNNKVSVLLFSSSSFNYGRSGTAIYSATKAAIANFTQAAGQEYAKHGVRINCIVPRRVNTSMRRDNFPEEDVSTNLSPTIVAEKAIEVLNSPYYGMLVHVR
jgi:2-C-methyl-D-erythritol 4-phosphate cytidylyltransferase